MTGLNAALGRQTGLSTAGMWVMPAGAEARLVGSLAAVLAQFCGVEVITVPWAVCRRAAWPNEKHQRRAVWLVPDGPARPLTPAVRRRVSALPASAVVVHGPLLVQEDVLLHLGLVDAVAPLLADQLTDADHPLAHLGVGAMPAAMFAEFSDTLAELLALVDAAAATAVSCEPEQGESPQQFWHRTATLACAHVVLERVGGIATRHRVAATAAWLAGKQHADADGAAKADTPAHAQLVRAGLRTTGSESAAPQWSRLASVLANADIRRRLRLLRPEWPWQVTGRSDRVDLASGTRAVGLFASCVAQAGLVPRSDGGLERMGIAALRQAIDQTLEPLDPARGALAPWLDLVARLGTTASAFWRDDDHVRLEHAEPARLRLAEFATTAGAKFAVAALFDTLAILIACVEPDGPRTARYWPSLRWTLQRMGPSAAPALAWLRTVVARVASSTSDPLSHISWAQELDSAEQELAGIVLFQPTIKHDQGWFAWVSGDGEGAKKAWMAASAAANRAGDTRQSVEVALDLCLAMLASGDCGGARRLASATTARLSAERDRVRVHWSAATEVLAALADPSNSDTCPTVVPSEAYNLFMTQTSSLENPSAKRELLDLGAIVRCAALMAEGRGPEAQTMLAYVLKQGRKARATAWHAATLVGMGYCALWLGDPRGAEAHWRNAVRLLDAPAMALLGHRIATTANLELGLEPIQSLA